MPRRKGWTIEEAERWLAPVLNYDRALAARARRPERHERGQTPRLEVWLQ